MRFFIAIMFALILTWPMKGGAFPLFWQTDEELEAAEANHPKLAPPRPDLKTLIIPKIDNAEEVVKRQLNRFQDSLANLIKDKPEAEKEIAEAYGRLGQTYHAYQLLTAAGTCYANAHQIAPQEFRWSYLLARIHHEMGELQEAETFYKLAAAQVDDYPALWVHLGDVLFQANRVEDAQKAFEQALSLSPRSAAALFGLGQVAMASGNHETAVIHFEDALSFLPQANRINFSLGTAYRNLGKTELAKSFLAKAGKIGPKEQDPLYEDLQNLQRGERIHTIQGKTAFNAGDYRGAVQKFTKAAQAAPESAGPRINLATALTMLGDVDSAIYQFLEALVLEPTNANTLFNLGSIYSRTNRLIEARFFLAKANVQLPEDMEIAYKLAEVLARTGADQEAYNLFHKVLEAEPDRAGAHFQIGQILMRQKQYKAALDQLNAAQNSHPENLDIAHLLAQLLAACPQSEFRDGARALELAQKVRQAASTAETTRTLALAHAESGDCAGAARLQRELIGMLAVDGRNDLLESARGTLTSYEKGAPCRPPVE